MTSQAFSARRTNIQIADCPQFLREQVTGVANSLFLMDAGVAMAKDGAAGFQLVMDQGVTINVEKLELSNTDRYWFDIITRNNGHSLSFSWPR